MKKSISAADPDSYVAGLKGWQKKRVAELRDLVRKAAPFEEVIKWRHLVYFSDGPVLLIRAEEKRVLFGFWRGQLLRGIEPRLKPGGKYEMATMTLDAETPIKPALIRRLVREAVALNATFGDPTDI